MNHIKHKYEYIYMYLWYDVEKYGGSRMAEVDNIISHREYTIFFPDNKGKQTQALVLFNTCRFSMENMVTRTRLTVTFYIHCPPCSKSIVLSFVYYTHHFIAISVSKIASWNAFGNRERSESRCALSLRYVDLVFSIEVAVEVCCCFTVFSC
jgi:hypothetical protein